MSLSVRGLSKSFSTGKDKAPVLDAVDIDVPGGTMLVVVGPSGSGKTTLLRCIAGLEHADTGTIEIGGRDMTTAPPGTRDVAMVFQDYALYPHLSVRGNISFGLKARKLPAADIDAAVQRAAAIVGLDADLDRSPGHLSGGERQRVALARALVRRPSAFLLDEPLSNLDAELRAQTRREIRSIQQALAVTSVYVTHDQVEAMTMGDRVAVLRAGRVEQVGPPLDLYERPANTFVARFLGSPPMNMLPSGIVDAAPGETIGVRPERIRLVSPGAGRFDARIAAVEVTGSEAIVHVEQESAVVLVRTDARQRFSVGDLVGVEFEASDVHRFEASGRAIR